MAVILKSIPTGSLMEEYSPSVQGFTVHTKVISNLSTKLESPIYETQSCLDERDILRKSCSPNGGIGVFKN